MERQRLLFEEKTEPNGKPFTLQLLKWIGNKQRFAHEIISNFPAKFDAYYEPFVGSGAVLGTLAREKGSRPTFFRRWSKSGRPCAVRLTR